MKPLVVLQNAPHERGDCLRQFLSSELIPHAWIATYSEEDFPPLETVSALIVLGSPRSVNRLGESSADQRLYAYAAAALRADLPYLGICYGGQLLAKILGAAVELHDRKEIGGGSVITLTDAGVSDPLFATFPESFPVFQWHGETFKIPHGATFLAQGSDCLNQSFRLGKAVAVQFHLDTGEEEASHWCDVSPGDVADAGKTKEQVMQEFRTGAALGKKLNDLLLKNYINSIR